MKYMHLGKTDLVVSRTAFGALPIQRIPKDSAVRLLHKALDNGITFFDTARYYSDSEEKLGTAFRGIRDRVVIATKAMASTKKEVLASCETSLRQLHTEYIDLMQLHNPSRHPQRSDAENTWEGLVRAREKGMVRWIGLTNHKLPIAEEAVSSGMFDSIQFPLNYLSSEDELKLIALCKENGCGCIAMKAMSGGLITNAAAAFAFLRQFDNVVPIWGIQREEELDEFISLEESPPELSDTLQKCISEDKNTLSGQFCRGCGYCMPCTAAIEINWVARMSLLLRRAPSAGFFTKEWSGKMMKIRDCTECGICKSRCPYQLDIPVLLKMNLTDYETFEIERPDLQA